MNPFDLDTYNFPFDPTLIAHSPPQRRTQARLMDCREPQPVDVQFSELASLLPDSCLFVRNITRVRQSRLCLQRKTGGQIEALVLRPLSERIWLGMFRPSRRLREGEELQAQAGRIRIHRKRSGGQIEFEFLGITDIETWLEEHGRTPFPPYIQADESLKNRYQTVFARVPGAAAAPTAGLHFDQELIQSLEKQGHQFVDVLLHVGAGTFQPVNTEDIRDFEIHSEQAVLEPCAARKIREARFEGRPVVAIGTTSLRVLESAFRANGFTKEYREETRLFLYPGQRISGADFLITNFHLPRSSLLMLIAAFLGARDWRPYYEHAVSSRYRFFSFGDAMLLPNLSMRKT